MLKQPSTRSHLLVHSFLFSMILSTNAFGQGAELPRNTQTLSDQQGNKGLDTFELRPPGLRPTPVDINCLEKESLAPMRIEESDMSLEARMIELVLKELSPQHGKVLFEYSPQSVIWWPRVFRKLSIETLGIAIHETNHAANWALTRCNGGQASYFLNGNVYVTTLNAGDYESYAVLDKYLPDQFKIYSIGARYSQYIKKNGTFKNTDYTVLIDELVAHVGAAILEQRIVTSKGALWLIPNTVTAYNGNMGGMVDFMLYTLVYLKTLRLDFPEQHKKIAANEGANFLLHTAWHLAESNLVKSFGSTVHANKSNILAIQPSVLSTVYSNEFISELDRLKIQHKSLSDWTMLYLKDFETNEEKTL